MKKYNIKNYTSTVPIERSIMQIEELLVNAGATHISKFFNDNMPEGILFQIPISNTLMPVFKLPSKVKQVEKIMGANTEAQKLQAHRTAWKLLHEWVHIQITMIKLEQISPIEAFLPYTYSESKNQTFYEQLEEEQKKTGSIKLLTQ